MIGFLAFRDGRTLRMLMSAFAVGCENLILEFKVFMTKFLKPKLRAFLSGRLVHPHKMRQLLLLYIANFNSVL